MGYLIETPNIFVFLAKQLLRLYYVEAGVTF